jgi:hypothetical protein
MQAHPKSISEVQKPGASFAERFDFCSCHIGICLTVKMAREFCSPIGIRVGNIEFKVYAETLSKCTSLRILIRDPVRLVEFTQALSAALTDTQDTQSIPILRSKKLGKIATTVSDCYEASGRCLQPFNE